MKDEKLRIMAIDDSTFNLNYLKENLSDEYEVYVSGSSVDAVDLIKKIIPEIILLDIVMPILNGYDLCRIIRNERELWSIPVIFITSQNDEKDIVKGFEAGAVDYIKKPFILSELKARLRTHLRIKKLEKYLLEQNKTLAEANNKKNKFIGIAAHDLRNPLQAIMGYADLLLLECTQEKTYQKEFLNNIIDSSNFMLSLINEILDVTVIENGHLNIKPVEGNIRELLQKNFEYNSKIAAKKNICLNLNFRGYIPDNIRFDSIRIEQVMNNLISNAVKYSYENTQINIDLIHENNEIKISVTDQGQGIPEKEQQNLFEYFSRTSVRPTKGESSIGLGLAIVKKIINEHNGDIKVFSEEGKGSTFTFSLPL